MKITRTLQAVNVQLNHIEKLMILRGRQYVDNEKLFVRISDAMRVYNKILHAHQAQGTIEDVIQIVCAESLTDYIAPELLVFWKE